MAKATVFAVVCVLAGCAANLLAGNAPQDGPAAPGGCMTAPAGIADGLGWRRAGADRTALDAWCSAVGSAVVSGPQLAEPATGPTAPADSLVVVTWNVHVGGGDLVRLVGDLRSGALTGGRPVGDFVLLLQEAHRAGAGVPTTALGAWPARIEMRPPSGDRIDVVEAARRLGLWLVYAPSMRNGPDGTERAEDRGNAILSTLPLGDLRAIELPFEAQRRVAVAGTVGGVTRAGTPWTLRVVSAHLDNRTRWTRFLDTFGAARTRQARALADAIDDPVAVVGADLNTWSAGFLESGVPLLEGAFPATPAQRQPTYEVAGVVPRTLDHLLFRVPEGWAARVHRVDDRYGSDHYPLIGVVKLGV